MAANSTAQTRRTAVSMYRDAMLDEYEQLPEAIKSSYTLTEYKALGDYGRKHLLESETMPDYEED